MARILVVDDEPQILTLTKMMLEGAGHEVALAINSQECFKKLEEEKPDLILLDIMLPGGEDGWSICREIKEDEKTRDILVAMFTVRTSDEDKQQSKDCLADAHIGKPFKKEELLSTVEDLIGSPS